MIQWYWGVLIGIGVALGGEGLFIFAMGVRQAIKQSRNKSAKQTWPNRENV